MNKINEMRIDFFATEENVAFARAAVSAFLPVSYTHLTLPTT